MSQAENCALLKNRKIIVISPNKISRLTMQSEIRENWISC